MMMCNVENANRFIVELRHNRVHLDDEPNARNPLVPFHIARAMHLPLTVVGVGRAPTENIGRWKSAARINRRRRARQPLQKRLIEIPPLRQRPTERCSREGDPGNQYQFINPIRPSVVPAVISTADQLNQHPAPHQGCLQSPYAQRRNLRTTTSTTRCPVPTSSSPA